MNLTTVTIAAAGFLLYSLVSGRLNGTMITAPMVFVAFGFAIESGGFGITHIDVGHSAIHTIAELTLILVLFIDAARLDVKQIRHDHTLPVRMLSIALPLTIAAGALVASWFFPQFSNWELLLLAALLAPTDAALGQAVVSAKEVPVRVRQAINVESGLNDGFALPAVLLFAALASSGQGGGTAADWLQFALLQITLGPVVGIVFGFVGARLLDEAMERGWATESFGGLGVLALALLCFTVAELIGGNGFISAFVGGMVFGASVRHSCTFLYEFMETEGQLLMLITFLVFGALLLPEGLAYLSWATVGFALLSLTVIRMVPVALSLIGTKVRLPTQLFLGWFGPRGLASILFVLLILEQSDVPHRDTILSITVVTVVLSVLLHGITAAPFARWYGRLADQMGECEEHKPVAELPLRSGQPEHLKTRKIEQ